MLACGTLGDSNCVDYSRPRREFDYITVGRKLAACARESWGRIEWTRDVSLSAVSSTLELNARMPSADEVKAAAAFLEKNVGDRPIQTWAENYARETVLLSRLPATRTLPHQVVRIGGMAVAASPCEVYGGTGLKIRARSPFSHHMNVGLANGYAGYLPPPDEHAMGGYSTWRARSSCLEVDAEPRCTKELVDLLERVWEAGA